LAHYQVVTPSKDAPASDNLVFKWTQGHQNVVLNYGRDPKGDFALYGVAYHDAGKKLLAAYEASGGYSIDCVPIVFLYRQALELNLKSVIIHGNRLLRLQDEPAITNQDIFTSHSLLELFSPVEKIIKYLRGTPKTGQ
jgi:hypothetical protein